jgi:hypothetical protein
MRLYITMLATVVKITRMEENERHLVQIFGGMSINFVRNLRGRLASRRIFGEIWHLKQPVLREGNDQ